MAERVLPNEAASLPEAIERLTPHEQAIIFKLHEVGEACERFFVEEPSGDEILTGVLSNFSQTLESQAVEYLSGYGFVDRHYVNLTLLELLAVLKESGTSLDDFLQNFPEELSRFSYDKAGQRAMARLRGRLEEIRLMPVDTEETGDLGRILQEDYQRAVTLLFNAARSDARGPRGEFDDWISNAERLAKFAGIQLDEEEISELKEVHARAVAARTGKANRV